MKWYLNPWRLVTMAAGTYGLLLGAAIEHVSDWDIGVSLLMAGMTYLLMPLFDQALRGGKLFYAFLVGDFCINTTYTLYWSIKGNLAVDAWNNYGASWALFLLCWAIWCLPGQPLPNPFIALRNLVKGRWGTGTTP